MKTLIIIGLLMFTISASAQGDDVCENPQTQLDMNNCAQQSYLKTQQNFAQLIEVIYLCPTRPDSLHDDLKDDRVQWDKYIVTACTAVANVENGNKEKGQHGSMWNMTYSTCMEAKTQSKIDDYVAIFQSYDCDKLEGLPEE